MGTSAQLPALRDPKAELGNLGGLGDLLSGKALNNAAQFGKQSVGTYNQLTAAERTNTAKQRQGDLNQLTRMGGGYMDALKSIDPTWSKALGAIDARLSSPGAADSPLLGQLNTSAGNALTTAEGYGPSALRQQLEQQAQGDLALGRNLSPEQIRNAEQQARAAYAARGLVYSPGAVGAEVLNRDSYAQALQDKRRAFAQGVQGLGLNEDTTHLQGVLGALGAGGGVEQLNQAGQNADRNFLLNATSTSQNALNPVMQLFSPRTAVAPTAGAQVLGGAANLINSYSPVLQYGSDVFNTNFNAQAANNASNAQLANQVQAARMSQTGKQVLPYFDGFGAYHTGSSGSPGF